ncbi:ATP-dependent Clp protease proteolytic subunit [Paenarthrobacter sp. PH39-S1]|uniref:ClpP family protease n=1 Tax=Paenarthrobacter sp. PH39-S1 TaxID=3046204 RepID=UPI0024B8BE44|nr:ATP-dependent Clp protease proteolytic subunit [Paenarthrobacter sp. PH39-S1]MDJ0356603.1 ATP-dependent Clp protease proteolytic subunit [Paenarthrobacter sp. PH39-S1]
MTEQRTPHPFEDSLLQQLMGHRILLLGTELDQEGGNRLCTQLMLLSAEDPQRDISLWINSPGGSVPAMLAIRDVMRLIPNDVSTVVLGLALSAGQFLLSAGTPGKRFALPHARVLLHQGSGGIGGTAMDIAIQAEDLRHTRDTVLGLIAEDTGQTMEQVTADSLRDRWYTAEQALEYGFVDRIIEQVDNIRPDQRPTVSLRGTR